MRLALEQAGQAAEQGEVPVGCVIVADEQVVGQGHNLREGTGDPTAHAEIVAIRQASETLGSWRLLGCTLVVTLEPCMQCVGAMILARVPRVVYGCKDPKGGALGSVLDLAAVDGLNHKLDVTGGVLAEQCGQILTEFFEKLRKER